MKECPVCSEAFPDDLRFCDVDGTRLTRKIEAGESRGSSRLWSLLGAGLLVGALVFTGAAIVFFPKTRGVPSGPIPGRIENAPAAAQTRPNDAASKEPVSEVAVNSGAPDAKPADGPPAAQDVVTQPRRKEAPTPDSGSSTAVTPNPKAAVKPDEDPDKAGKKNSSPETSPAKTTAGSTDTVSAKPTSPPANETAGKTDQAAADPKKDPKHASKATDKDPNSNKKDEKKGGFFRVFKKIFGKN